MLLLMKCSKCGNENKDTANFCKVCGNKLYSKNTETKSSYNQKLIIIALILVIIILIAAISFLTVNNNPDTSDDVNIKSADSIEDGAAESEEVTHTPTKTSSVESHEKSWQLIGSYSGSGSGFETISVPPGKIKVEVSAYPIKNYATNHVYVLGSNGKEIGVDWGSKSAVKTRSDSVTYTSDTSETFSIDYYETVSWEVNFYIYE